MSVLVKEIPMFLYNEEIHKIAGAVIGVGRAAEGNKNRPDANTHQVLLDALSHINVYTDSITAQEIVEKLHEEKYKLVPRCLSCAKQCGRNNDFICEELNPRIDELTSIKFKLLTLIIEIGNKMSFIIPTMDSCLANTMIDQIYDTLFVVGSTKSIETHQQYLKSTKLLYSEIDEHIIMQRNNL